MALGAPCRKQVQAVRREDSEAREFKAEGPGDCPVILHLSMVTMVHIYILYVQEVVTQFKLGYYFLDIGYI